MPEIGVTHGDEVGNASRMSSQVERQTMPNVTIAKAMLAIVVDSLEVSFTRYGGNLWKYDSSASRPVLAPLISTRTSVSSKEDDTNWQGFFDKLVEDLPSDVAARLIIENEKPKNERNEAYMALNNLLVGTAKALLWIESASKLASKEATDSPPPPLLSDIAGENLRVIGKEFLKEAFNFLDSIGSNYAHHDKLLNNLKQMETGFNRMEYLRKQGK